MRGEGCSAFVRGLARRHKALSELNVCGHDIRNQGMAALAELVHHGMLPQKVYLRGNNIRARGYMDFANALESSGASGTRDCVVDMSHNPVDKQTEAELHHAAARTRVSIIT